MVLSLIHIWEQDLAIELISLCNQQKVSILFRQAGDHDYCGDDDTGIAIQLSLIHI